MELSAVQVPKVRALRGVTGLVAWGGTVLGGMPAGSLVLEGWLGLGAAPA